jgi:hypothetical protein
MDSSNWFGGAAVHEDTWSKDDKWEEDTKWGTNWEENTPVSLRSLDPTFIRDVTSLKNHCYDITVTKDPLDSERAQSMDPLQDYITLLSNVHRVLQNAPYDTEELKMLPVSVQTKLAPLLEWIRQFCETHRDPVDRIPFQSYLRMNIIENPYVQSKIME